VVEPFLGEIRIFGFGDAPQGWALCNGQLLPIDENQALFSLLGATYGGDGETTFALPDLQGSLPMQSGQGLGLSLRALGETGGSETVTLSASGMPAHAHVLQASVGLAAGHDPTDAALARSRFGGAYGTASSLVNMSTAALSSEGGGLAHNNLQPYLTLNFCIALQGVFPE
jgi:microcystin-dependent protein